MEPLDRDQLPLLWPYFVTTLNSYITYNFAQIFVKCLKMLNSSPLTCHLRTWGRNRAAPVLSPFQKWPLSPIIPLSTCPLQCECVWVSSALPLPLSWVICCVNMVYLQLTGPFSCGAGNAITGCKHLHCYHWRVQRSFRSPLQRGPLLIGISFEEGITNEAIWKPFCAW